MCTPPAKESHDPDDEDEDETDSTEDDEDDKDDTDSTEDDDDDEDEDKDDTDSTEEEDVPKKIQCHYCEDTGIFRRGRMQPCGTCDDGASRLDIALECITRKTADLAIKRRPAEELERDDR